MNKYIFSSNESSTGGVRYKCIYELSVTFTGVDDRYG